MGHKSKCPNYDILLSMKFVYILANSVDPDFVCLFDLILYVSVNNFKICRDRSSWFEPVLSTD